jgi:hypothetical protein
MTAIRGKLQFNMDSNHSMILEDLTITILSLTEVKASVCEQNNLHIDLAWNETQDTVNGSSVSYHETTWLPVLW